MKYLDQEIELTFNNLPNTSTNQSYVYTLYQNNNPVFVGSVYKGTTDTSLKVNVTEILLSCHYNNNTIELPLKHLNTSIASGVLDDIYARLVINSSTYSSQHEDVVFAYHYPRYIKELNYMSFYPHNYQYVALNNMLQGTNGSSVLKVLMPEIPYYPLEEYGFGTVYQLFNFSSPRLCFGGDLVGSIALNCSTNTNIYYDDLSVIFEDAMYYVDDFDLIDPDDPYLVTGQAKGGNAIWTSDISFDFNNTPFSQTEIYAINSYGLKLSSDGRFENVPAGETTHIKCKIKGHHDLYAFRIGSTQNYVLIPIIAGHEDMFQDNKIREFTFEFDVYRDDLSSNNYKITSLQIYFEPSGLAILKLEHNTICNINLCQDLPSYYLEWIDRYGSFQSQPFTGKMTYTETVDSLEIQNYTGERRKTFWKTQGKFQINSGWLKDGVYPIYESILTSPHLLLFDIRNDKSYNVICTDKSYEEKTYKNQKKMFNLTLNLEINKSQSKIY